MGALCVRSGGGWGKNSHHRDHNDITKISFKKNLKTESMPFLLFDLSMPFLLFDFYSA